MTTTGARLVLLPPLCVLTVVTCSLPAGASERNTVGRQPAPAGPVRWLVLDRVGQYGRAPVHTDPLEADIIAGRWNVPQPGDPVIALDGSVRRWQEATPAADGWLQHEALQGGYACMLIEADAERVMLLDAAGHGLVYVNGVPRAGDPYGAGWVLLPVRLKAGTNAFLFHVGRGRVRARLLEPKADAQFNTGDATLPDLLAGRSVAHDPEPVWAALPVINTTDAPTADLLIEAAHSDQQPLRTALPPIPPLSTRKVGFRVRPALDAQGGEVTLRLRLLRVASGRSDQLLDETTLKLRVCAPTDKHKRTFISAIDGSVQYYAVTPGRLAAEGAPAAPALFLTLHGAGVEATGQANAYDHKTWGHIVAPTNRRPYGFDWEDWGRLDALEVLGLAQQQWQTDPRRVYLTGHSMGGHGVWHLGATFPDRFAAIGPSAAWPDFWSYAGAAEYEHPTPIERILARSVAPSRTLALARNYLHYGVYVLHGAADDNVPVELARKMRTQLGGFHPDFAYCERPGAGHWWDSSPDPGVDCVDWPPMFDFFRYHTRPTPESVRQIEFWTSCPGVSASAHWVTIEAQRRQLEPCRVTIMLDPQTRKFSGTTDNVARLALDLTALSRPRADLAPDTAQGAPVLPPGEPVTIELDGQTLTRVPWPAEELRIWLRREEQRWTVSTRPSPTEKGPQRYGPFKEAFRNRFTLVYATRGTAEENATACNKARLDAETFWYRANGAADVVADVDFDPARDPQRNVILYGNADTNAIWPALLADSPVQVRRRRVAVGQRELSGDDLAVLFLRPRPGSEQALVGVVAGSGPAGMRLTERLPYFLSGVGYPDCIVLGPEVLTRGSAGIRVAGFFGLDWQVETGDFAWAE